MKIKYFSLTKKISLFSLIFLLTPLASTAIDRSTAGRILDDFKEKQETLLFSSLSFTETGASDLLIHEYTMNGLEALKSKLDLMQSGYKLKKNLATEKRFSLEEALRVLDVSITQTEDSIKANTDTIALKNKHIEKLRIDSLDTKRKITKHRGTILKYIAHVYSEGNKIYSKTGSIDIIQTLVLSEGAIDLIISDMTYTSLVSELGQQFVSEYRSALKDYYILTLQIEDEISHLQLLRKELESQSNILLSQKDERKKLLEITKGQEALFESYIKAQTEAQETVESAWLGAEANYARTMQATLKKYGCGDEIITEESARACHNVRSYFANEKKLQTSEFDLSAINVFAWPVSGRNITTYFHDGHYYNLFGSQHDAIDIAVNQGTNVVASGPGYAYFIVPPKSGGYSYMAIKHPGGFVTVYGHLSEILVSEGQFVQGGDLIAKSGGLPGTPGAGPMTTGPHLHFEVWKDRKPVDPLRFLSLAGMDFELLPGIYEDKFIQDIIEASGNEKEGNKYQKKFVIKGNNEKERQEYLLNKYATLDFQDWNAWIDAGIDERIDPSFLMCVGLAETTLGNRLKTTYNIGNVGNTDSGDTYSFESSSEGIKWMAKTFNNKFLKEYTKISELSRWGNNEGTIYASSGGNWHNNIIQCLSALKGRFVENDFEFRIKN